MRNHKNGLFNIFKYWVFQGTRYMDKSELSYKLILELSFFIGIWSILYFQLLFLNLAVQIFVAIIISHTLNFFLISNFWGLLGDYKCIKEETIMRRKTFINWFNKKIKLNKYIIYSGVYGSKSLSRSTCTEVRNNSASFDMIENLVDTSLLGKYSSSDFDVRVVRKKGARSYISLFIFDVGVSIKAIMHFFPLDMYIGDSMKFLDKLNKNEQPIIIKSSE